MYIAAVMVETRSVGNSNASKLPDVESPSVGSNKQPRTTATANLANTVQVAHSPEIATETGYAVI